MKPESVTEDIEAGYFKALDMLQTQLQLRGTKFLDGTQPGYADYMIWPWFEGLPAVNDKRKELDETKYKVLVSADFSYYRTYDNFRKIGKISLCIRYNPTLLE